MGELSFAFLLNSSCHAAARVSDFGLGVGLKTLRHFERSRDDEPSDSAIAWPTTRKPCTKQQSPVAGRHLKQASRELLEAYGSDHYMPSLTVEGRVEGFQTEAEH